MGCHKLTYNYYNNTEIPVSKYCYLGNVLNVVTDRKLPVDIPLTANSPQGDGIVDYFTADVVSYSDYLCFGQLAPNRHGSEGSYRYGYQGSEIDDELKGNGNSYTTFYRALDVRLGRWMSLDPKASSLPWQSPYCSMDNNPIWHNDPMGDWVPSVKKEEVKVTKDGKEETVTKGYLIIKMEKGDDAKSLAKFLGVSNKEAKKLMKTNATNKEGDYMKVPEKIAGTINKAIQHAIDNPSDYIGGIFNGSNYTCHESSLALLNQRPIDYEHLIDNNEMPGIVSQNNGYTEVDGKNGNVNKFGRTLIYMSDGKNTVHSATYLGTSKDGTIYTWTKNGSMAIPKVQTLKEVKKDWNAKIIIFFNRYQ